MSREREGASVANSLARHASAAGGPQMGILGEVLIKHLIDAQPHKTPVQVLQELHKRLIMAQRGALDHEKGQRK
jgi:hypothetical protein